MLETNHPFTIALTGGIASGKTVVSDEFAKLGIAVIDADVIAHEIVEPGQPALEEIKHTMGTQFIDKNGQLKRSDLRDLIFSDPKARKHLESILHPQIRQKVRKAIEAVTSAYCILVIPLLADRDVYPYLDRVLVVDVEPDTQVHRLMARDNCNRQQALQVLAAQPSRAQRLEIADEVLNNSGSLTLARDAVARLHKRYTQLATQQR